jgi:pyrroline-5-carboxylate reductase
MKIALIGYGNMAEALGSSCRSLTAMDIPYRNAA